MANNVIALTATSERPAITSSGYTMLIVLALAILADAFGIQQLGSHGGGLIGSPSSPWQRSSLLS